MQGDVILIGVFGLIFSTIFVSRWLMRRDKKRRDSLRQNDSGDWTWIDFDGTPRQSKIHPESKGGAWYRDPDSGDGSDFGSDGRGGGDGGGGGGGGGD